MAILLTANDPETNAVILAVGGHHLHPLITHHFTQRYVAIRQRGGFRRAGVMGLGYCGSQIKDLHCFVFHALSSKFNLNNPTPSAVSFHSTQTLKSSSSFKKHKWRVGLDLHIETFVQLVKNAR